MILVLCPHCSQLIEIVELNCRIFRCGIYRQNGFQIPPHLPKIECDRLAENGSIYGCGKPFRVEMVELESEKKYIAIICDYI
jgi:hypothetical protein